MRTEEKVIEVWNKVDLLDAENLAAIQNVRENQKDIYMVSAINGTGLAPLLERIEREIANANDVVDISLPVQALSHLSWIYENTHVISRQDGEDGSVQFQLRANRAVRLQLRKMIDEAQNVD